MLARQGIQQALACTLLFLMQAKANETLSHLPVDAHRQVNIVQWISSIFLPKPAQINSAANSEATAGNCTACFCGVASRNSRIVGGYEAKVNQYPWMASLKLRGQSYCGGSLISDLYILTSARCVKGFPKEMLLVSLMDYNRENNKLEVLDRKVDAVLIHDEYSTLTYDNDIGLIKLSERVEPSSFISPVCMPSPGLDYAGEPAYILGWGMTNESGYLADRLQEVRVTILSQPNCRGSKYGPDRITGNMMCAGLSEGGKDACQGDSGGPLLIYLADSNTFHVAGIVSWGEGCARPELPGIYTRVNRYLNWIEQNTGDSCKCTVPANKIEPEENKRLRRKIGDEQKP